MKVFNSAAIVASVVCSSTQGFILPQPNHNNNELFAPLLSSNNRLYMADTPPSATESVQASAYERIGFPEDKVAIGLDPQEIFKWLGTRDDLIAKFEKDNPKFDKERAALEVDKFMMDGEMVMNFVRYEQRKAEPGYLKEQAEAQLNDPSTWVSYVAFLAGGAGFALLKNLIIEPKYQSGEWQEIKIQLPQIFNSGS